MAFFKLMAIQIDGDTETSPILGPLFSIVVDGNLEGCPASKANTVIRYTVICMYCI